MAAHRILPHKTALFICDIQERFRTAIYGFDHVVQMSAKMLKTAAIVQKISVYATEQNPRALGPTVPQIGLTSLPQAQQPLGRAIDKTKFSMIVPDIEKSLEERGIETILLTGIESHVCVLQTALDLLDRRKSVYVLADAVSSCNKEETSFALERMRRAGAIISTTESVLFELMGDAKYEHFKALSGLIKARLCSTVVIRGGSAFIQETKVETRESLADLCPRN